MTIQIEVKMKDGTVKHETVKANSLINAHQKMHKKYKGHYNTTVINQVISN